MFTERKGPANKGLEPTASSVRYAPASGSGSGLALGGKAKRSPLKRRI